MKPILIAAAIFACAPVLAQAASVSNLTVNATLSASSADQASYSLPGFDSALGTLTGVSLSFDADADLTLSQIGHCSLSVGRGETWRCLDDPRIMGRLDADLSVTLTGPDGQVFTQRKGARQITQSLTNTVTVDTDVLIPELNSAGYVTGSPLSFTVTVATNPASDANKSWFGITRDGPNLTASTLSATYSFEPVATVPLPAGMLFLGTGLAAMGVAARRRRG